MNLSSKILGLNPSPTVALNAKAQQLEKQGAKVLNFAVGEPDFPTPKAIVDIAIQSLQNGKTKYGPAGGGLPFRQAIADKLNRDNHLSFDPSQVVCGIGAKELLFHIFLAMLNDGDEVILSAPCWVSYKDQIKAAGGVPIVIPMPESPSAPLIDVHTIDKYASDRTVAYVLCSPNNPAGYMVDPESLKKLAGYLSTKSWWIVSDEIYEYLAFDQPHQSILAIAPDLKGKTVIVNGMSKGFAMTGWRVGYAAGPSNIISLVKGLQSHSSTCLPPFIEEAATWAIQQGPSLMKNEIAILKRRRDFAVAKLNEIPGLHLIPPQGAFYLFVDMREALANSQSFGPANTMKFSEMLLNDFHLAVVPGEAFEAPGYLRFSYATDEEKIGEGFGRLKEALKKV